MRVHDLENAYRVITTEDSRIAPGGPMAAYVGEQLTPDILAQAYLARSDGEDLPPRWLPPVVRSFTVPTLIGLTCELTADGAGRELRAALASALPGVWVGGVDSVSSLWGPIAKYGVLDTNLFASRDEATGHQMTLEVGGDCIDDDGSPLPRVTGDRATVRITRAHWTNVSGLCVGGPFYL